MQTFIFCAVRLSLYLKAQEGSRIEYLYLEMESKLCERGSVVKAGLSDKSDI